MSQYEAITIIDDDTVESFLDGWNNVAENSILIILHNNLHLADDIGENILLAFDDPKIGFVYTDLIVQDSEMRTIKYFDGIALPDGPFFMRKIPGLEIPADITKVRYELMNQLVQNGYYFEHISDPLIIVSV